MQELLIRNLIIYIFLIINLVACNLIGVSSIDAKSMNNITLCVNAVTNESLSKNDLSKLEAEIQNRDLDCNKYKQAIYAVMSSRQSQINKMQSRAMASAENKSIKLPVNQRSTQASAKKQIEKTFNLVHSRITDDRDFRVCFYREKTSGQQKEVIISKDDFCQSVKLDS